MPLQPAVPAFLRLLTVAVHRAGMRKCPWPLQLAVSVSIIIENVLEQTSVSFVNSNAPR